MLSRRLQRRGYRVEVAADGLQALEVVGGGGIDLVLLDIMMPGIDGFEVLRRLRQTHSASELPIIMQTAKAQSDDIVRSSEAGANDHVVKPLNFRIVAAKVEALLKMKDSSKPSLPSAAPTEIRPGATIEGKYELIDLIGSGTFGAVYRARHIGLSREVAIKFLQPSVTASEESRRRFRQEGVTACLIDHPNAVAVSDYGITADGVGFLVMELLSGFSVLHELRQTTFLSPRRAGEILEPVCAVLGEAHGTGLVHRDIKPENIFLHQGRRGETVKVLDFGIAKWVGENVTQENLTAEGWVLGTPAYMAPERLESQGYDGRADVYSLGVMLFEMLTGQRPFQTSNNDPMAMIMLHVREQAPSLRSVRAEVPEALEAVVAWALAKNPLERPSAEELAAAYRQALQRIEAPETGPAPQPPGVDEPGLLELELDKGLPEIDTSAPTVPFDSKGQPGLPPPEKSWLSGLLDRLKGFWS